MATASYGASRMEALLEIGHMGAKSLGEPQSSFDDFLRGRDLSDLRQALVGGADEALAADVAHIVEQHGILLEVSRTVSSNLSLDVLLPDLVVVITKMLRAERATLFLWDPKTDELYSRVARGGRIEEIRIPSASGIAGAAFRDRQVLNIPDAYADPRFNQEVDKKTGYRTRNILCAPLRNRSGEVIGVIQVLNKRDGDFDAADTAPLETLAAHAATALEHAQMFESLEKARQEQVDLMELMTTISDEMNLDVLLGTIIERTTKLLGADRGTFFLYDDKSDELWSIVAEGVRKKEIRIPRNAGVAGWSFSNDEVVNIPDAYADSRFNPSVDRGTGFRTRSILSMPVKNKLGRSIGVIQILNKKEGDFTSNDERRLSAFSAQVVAAVENAQLFDEVLELKNFNEGILKSLTNGVVTLDAEHLVTKANEAACRILAVEESELLGRNAAALFGNSNPWILKSLDYVARTGKTDFHLDTDLHQSDETTISVNLHVAPLPDIEGELVGAMLVLEDITREKRVRGTMARYMAKEVVDKLLESGDEVLEGVKQEATVLFSDIRRFSTISEKLGTQATVNLLNEYFTEMVEVVFRNGGILDKYIGDAIMTVFGAPVSDPRDADNALLVAKEMMHRLREFNQRRQKAGDEPIEIGIGLSTGEVLAGSIGSVKRMEYTVIGNTVNLAARLESANKFYGTRILLGADTVARLTSREILREIDVLRVKGLAQPVAIYEPIEHRREAIQEKLFTILPIYQRGMTAYRTQHWNDAIAAFRNALTRHPDDGPSQILLDRCLYYKDNPPPDDWDGVWTLKHK